MDRTWLQPSCCSRAPPVRGHRPVRGRACLVAASSRQDRGGPAAGRRLQRRSADQSAVAEPSPAVPATPAAVGTSAAERAASSSGRSTLLNGASSGSSSILRNGSSIGSSSSSVERRDRLRVAVDVDEVLGRFLHSLNKFCHEEYGMVYDVSDYHVYDFAKIWTCSQDESNHKVHEFFKSHHFAAGAFESLQRLRSLCDLVVVTSRQHVIQEPTLEWLEEHYPETFAEVHFGNHFALEGQSRKKSEICRAIGAEVLIDDNPAYASECAAAGIHVLLYDWQHGYPWSKTPDGGPSHDRITRVRDWAEVEQVLGVLAAQRAA